MYSSGCSGDVNSGLVKVTAKLLDIQYTEINVSAPVPKGKEDPKTKSLTGKFPVLETPEGFTIFEGTSIAKYFARQRRGFYGLNDYESKFISSFYLI